MKEKKNKSFEEKMNQLEELVLKIESGEIPLEEVIAKFNEAMIIANDCDKTLKEATETVKKILNKNNELENFNQKD